MLNIKRKLSQKGFSLIELMVAVVILALAIFGIFQAYSVGFMGMADARAITVATNYAREAMEDIKNMDFGEIPTPEIVSGSVTVNGIIYNRQVIVQENINIKKVITTVTWKDRNDKQKMVETDMVVSFIETTAGDAIRIMLYASPYNVLVRETNEEGNPVDAADANKSTITAVIKDAIGNTIIDWDKEVIFSLTGSAGSNDNLSDTTITPEEFSNGKAIITFTSGTTEGEVTITASTEGLTSDSVTINVYDPGVPVKINLTAYPYSMLPNTTAQSVITAVIANAGGTKVDDTTNEITFSITGPGTFSSSTTITTITANAEDGEVDIDLFSNATPGTITVTASAFNLVPGVVVVLTGGHITLSASPIEVPNGEQSKITVTTKDVNGLPIKYNGSIDLLVTEIDGGSCLLPDSVSFDGSTSSNEVTFTATSDVGAVNITATDSDSILTDSDILTLTLKERLTPHHIIVYGMPLSIPAGGTETSLITAKVMTEGNVKITSYTNDITFTTTAGTFSGGITLITSTFVDGIATVSLYSSNDAETAEITGSSTVLEVPERIITGSTEVGFYIGPDHIELTAVPQNISVDGQTCIVTAKIVDLNGTVISDYNEDIGFSISPWPKTINFLKATTAFLTQKFKKGITTVILKSGAIAGTAVIVAYSGNVSGSLNIPVGITLNLVATPAYNFAENSVSFDIMIVGAPLSLEEMQVSWLPNGLETLSKIVIQPPNTSVPVTIFNNIVTPALNGEPINVNDITLLAGISNVKLYFNASISMYEKILKVIFNPNSGNYPVEFTIPASTS